MLKNYQLNQVKEIIAGLRKQVDADSKGQHSRSYYDFGWATTVPAAKELLGGSLSSVLQCHSFILKALGLRVLSYRCSVFSRWSGPQTKVFKLLVPKCDHTVEEALSDGRLETHQSLLDSLIKMI